MYCHHISPCLIFLLQYRRHRSTENWKWCSTREYTRVDFSAQQQPLRSTKTNHISFPPSALYADVTNISQIVTVRRGARNIFRNVRHWQVVSCLLQQRHAKMRTCSSISVGKILLPQRLCTISGVTETTQYFCTTMEATKTQGRVSVRQDMSSSVKLW